MDKNSIELLTYLHECQIGEVRMRRSRELNIFLWTSTVLVGLTSLLLVSESTKTVLWEEYGLVGKIIAISVISVICVFSILGQNKEREYGQKNKKVIVRLNTILGFHEFRDDIKSPLLDSDWINWGNAKLTNPKRYFRPNFVTYTWTLAVINILTLILL